MTDKFLDKPRLRQNESLDCGQSTPCKFLVIEVGNSDSTNQVFFSGAVHGNERVGPAAVLASVELICEGLTGIDLTDRLVVTMPMTNPAGYYADVREENTRDPNRDFPYDQLSTSDCLRTITARVVHRMMYEYGHIQSGITFHAGEQSITYPWGSFNHLNDVAADTVAMAGIANELQRIGGFGVYETGSMNDVVYAVHGGLEDWAYASAFETPVACVPSTFGGYSTNYTDSISIPSALMMLVETTTAKEPAEADLGSEREVWITDDSVYISPVPRCVRMIVAVVKLAKPTFEIVPLWTEEGIPAIVRGCIDGQLMVSTECVDPALSTDFVTHSFTCQNELIYLPIVKYDNTSCSMSLRVGMDLAWSEADTVRYLEYTDNRTFFQTADVPTDTGLCVDIIAGQPVCVSDMVLFVHPLLIHHKPVITISSAGSVLASATNVILSLSTIAQVTTDKSLHLTFRSTTGDAFTFSGLLRLVQPQQPASAATHTSRFLLLLIILIPVGILGYLYWRFRAARQYEIVRPVEIIKVELA